MKTILIFSNDKIFYHHLRGPLNVEIFVLGEDRYETYQEYLVMDQYVDSIQPDLVVWQFFMMILSTTIGH